MAFGSLLPEVLQLQFGALELALEAPGLFLGVPEMVPAMELELLLVREPVTALEFVPVKGLLSQINWFRALNPGFLLQWLTA